MFLSEKSLTETGNVAEKSMTCLSFGWYCRSCSMTGVNSWDRSLSASSMMNMGHSLRSATFFPARSRIRPGVPTTIWTGSCRRIISSRKPVPPVVTMTLTPRCFPSVLQTCEVCMASSLVGTSIKHWILDTFGLIFSRAGMTKAAVFPVPFFARARISRPVRATGIASSWIGDGRSKPASNIPMRRPRLRAKFSNSSPFVFVTS